MSCRRCLGPVLAAALACAAAPGRGPPVERAARGALERFSAAAEAGRWQEAWTLLSARWRARTTPARLADDFRASGPVGPEALVRVRALLASGAPLSVREREAVLAVGQGRAARLVAEEGGWRVDALE